MKNTFKEGQAVGVKIGTDKYSRTIDKVTDTYIIVKLHDNIMKFNYKNQKEGTRYFRGAGKNYVYIIDLEDSTEYMDPSF